MSIELKAALRPVVEELLNELLAKRAGILPAPLTPLQIREKAGFLTQKQAAKCAQVSSMTLSRYESGHIARLRAESQPTIKRLADLFGVPKEEYERAVLANKKG